MEGASGLLHVMYGMGVHRTLPQRGKLCLTREMGDVAMRGGILNIILESAIPYPSGTWDMYSPAFQHAARGRRRLTAT